MQSLTLLAFLTIGVAQAEKCAEPAVARGDRKEKEVTLLQIVTGTDCNHRKRISIDAFCIDEFSIR